MPEENGKSSDLEKIRTSGAYPINCAKVQDYPQLSPGRVQGFFFLAGSANAVQVECVVRNLKIEQFAYHGFDLLDARVAELHDFTAIGADDVVVLFIPVGFFVLGEIFPELVFFYQIAGYQQLQRIIHGGPADAVIAVFHVDVQRFRVKMVAAFINFFQDCKALRRFAQTVAFQVTGKDIQYLFEDFFIVLGCRGHGRWIEEQI
jgi:hypothetical protein